MTSRTMLLATDSPEDRVTQAADALRGGVTVVVDGRVALRHSSDHLECNVIDPHPGSHRCAQEYDVLIENARRILDASTLRPRLPELPRRWRVVEANGTVLAGAGGDDHE